MAFPVILVDSATGSDSLASGAGPATALTGTAGATDATGLIVTLDSGTVLTGVLTDGSHVIYFNHTTGRNFGKITATSGSGGATPTVTVADAFTVSLSGKSWAIGGKRASAIQSTSSLKLLTNGDILAGWAIEMASAHVEPTITGSISIGVSGSATDGPITLRGASGAATMPLITFSNNGAALSLGNGRAGWQFRDFEIRNTGVTKSASVALTASNSTNSAILISNVKISHSTGSHFWKAFNITAGGVVIADCEIGYCASIGVTFGAAGTVRNCWIHNCGSHGISLTGAVGGSFINRNTIAGNAGDGINDARTGGGLFVQMLTVTQNTIDSNSGDGFESTMTSAQVAMVGAIIENNIVSNNGGYGLIFSGTGGTDAQLNYLAARIRNNNTYLNTSGPIFPTTLTVATNDPGLDPAYTNAAGGDYSIGTNLKAKGYPLGGTLAIGTLSSTYSYEDIGAAQRQESGGSGGRVFPPVRSNTWHNIG